MTLHSLSTALHSMELEHSILCDVIDSAFGRGVLNVQECRKVQGILHRRGCDTLTTGSIAKRIVKKYRDRVKCHAGPDGGKDGTFTQACKNVEKLMKQGYNHGRLIYAVEHYARQCDSENRGWKHRFNAGNFFGRAEQFKSYLPEGDAVVEDADKAAQVEGLFNEDDDV